MSETEAPSTETTQGETMEKSPLQFSREGDQYFLIMSEGIKTVGVYKPGEQGKKPGDKIDLGDESILKGINIYHQGEKYVIVSLNGDHLVLIQTSYPDMTGRSCSIDGQTITISKVDNGLAEVIIGDETQSYKFGEENIKISKNKSISVQSANAKDPKIILYNKMMANISQP